MGLTAWAEEQQAKHDAWREIDELKRQNAAMVADNERLVAQIAELQTLRDSLAHRLNDVSIACKISNAMIDETKAERDALMAQVGKLKQSLISVRARGNLLHTITIELLQGGELNGSDWDYISEDQVKEIEEITREIRAEAGRAGYIQALKDFAPVIEDFSESDFKAADIYAAKLRKGGEQ